MFGITTTRRLRADLAAARAETDRQRTRAENAEGRAQTAEFNRAQVLRQFADADAANRRLDGRNLRLGERLAALAEGDPDYNAALEQRLTRALTGAARYLDAYWTQREQTLTAIKQHTETTSLLKSVNERLAAAELRASKNEGELRSLVMFRGERYVEGGRPRFLTGSDELRLARSHSRALEARLQEMTVANARCTCQRQGVES